MSDKSRDEVIRLIVDKFPAVPEEEMAIAPKGPSEDAYSAFMKHLAHLAIHENDKRNRDSMADCVRTKLFSGEALSVGERAWLLYVLAKLPDMPHEAKGRAIRSEERMQLILQLIGFINSESVKNRAKTVTKRLDLAASEFRKSYETIRALYYSASYKNLSKYYSERGIIDQGDK